VEGYVRRQLRVFVVDDHDIVRQGLRDLLTANRDIYLVGDTGSAARAVAVIPALKPDVVLLDLQLQDGSGIEVCRAVRAADSSIQALLVTAAGDQEALTATLLAGAAGFVIKLARSGRILEAVRRAGARQPLLDPRLVEQASRRIRDGLQAGTPAPTEEQSRLLDAILTGLTDGEIAEREGRSVECVTTEAVELIGRLATART